MKNRHDLPLSLLAAIGDSSIEGRTRLQKLLFLIQKRAESDSESGIEQGYEFIAYDYGPFSKEIYDDIERLSRRGLIKEDPKKLDDGVIKYDYKLTEKGEAIAAERGLLDDLPEIFNEVIAEFGDEELDEIIDHVYSEYPEYAENSVLQ